MHICYEKYMYFIGTQQWNMKQIRSVCIMYMCVYGEKEQGNEEG
jgi:hypothetical protein